MNSCSALHFEVRSFCYDGHINTRNTEEVLWRHKDRGRKDRGRLYKDRGRFYVFTNVPVYDIIFKGENYAKTSS